jgi:hypothetical protein
MIRKTRLLKALLYNKRYNLKIDLCYHLRNYTTPMSPYNLIITHTISTRSLTL